MVFLTGLNIKKNRLKVGIMSEFHIALMAMKELEKELEYNSDPVVRHYIKAVDEVMKEMQAYIDYLLLEE